MLHLDGRGVVDDRGPCPCIAVSEDGVEPSVTMVVRLQRSALTIMRP